MIKPTLTPNPEAALLRSLLFVVLLVWSALIFSLSAKPVNAVDQDRFIAAISAISLEEQARSGVPASITAAQAILESNWGRAPIAVAGNNYFGIKCKSYWTGNAVYHPDDDYDADGNLTESCFRAYERVEDSFRDHSDFLLSSERYAPLFELSPSDYRGWAHGLRTCGYATDKRYGDKLIAIIERLELYALDWPQDEDTEWLMANTESGVEIVDEHTWTDLPAGTAPAEYQPPASETPVTMPARSLPSPDVPRRGVLVEPFVREFRPSARPHTPQP